ncbi:MAG: SRPBCC domain-containing protein [Sphingomonas sp.]
MIQATREALYAAFLDPVALAEWLPPARMTGRIHSFDGREGGGYRSTPKTSGNFTARPPTGKTRSRCASSSWRRPCASSRRSASSATIPSSMAR